MGQQKIKKEVVEEYLRGGVSLRELEKDHGINFRTIHRWVKEAERELAPEERKVRQVRRSVAIRVRELPADVKQLRKELEEAELKNELLNAMIDIAEDQFGIEIRKKRGARQ